MGRYMKQIFDGKDFTDSSGKTVKSMTIGIGAEMKKGFDSAFGYFEIISIRRLRPRRSRKKPRRCLS